jgi:hypothetical protein
MEAYRNTRRDAKNDVIRQTYIDFITRAELLFDAVREIQTYENPPDQGSDIYKDYLGKWEAVIASYGAVSIAGASSVTECAKMWFDCLKSVCNPTDDCIHTGTWIDSYDATFKKVEGEKKNIRDSFVEAATSSLAEPK